LRSGGSPGRTVTSAVHPCAIATPVAISASRSCSTGRAVGDMVRRVPRAVAISGVAFAASPARSAPIVTTVGTTGSAVLLTSCCALTAK
jgi:hypothetical protein